MESKIKSLRVELDHTVKVCAGIVNETMVGLQNVNNSFVSLRLARGWLGKALFYLGLSAYPRADSLDKIPPTEDVHTPRIPDSIETDEQMLFAINDLREAIDNFIKVTEPLIFSVIPDDPELMTEGSFLLSKCFSNTWQYLHEARMHLGFQLEMMRNLHQESQNTQTKETNE